MGDGGGAGHTVFRCLGGTLMSIFDVNILVGDISANIRRGYITYGSSSSMKSGAPARRDASQCQGEAPEVGSDVAEAAGRAEEVSAQVQRQLPETTGPVQWPVRVPALETAQRTGCVPRCVPRDCSETE